MKNADDNVAHIKAQKMLDEINEVFETLENKPKGYIKGIVVM